MPAASRVAVLALVAAASVGATEQMSALQDRQSFWAEIRLWYCTTIGAVFVDCDDASRATPFQSSVDKSVKHELRQAKREFCGDNGTKTENADVRCQVMNESRRDQQPNATAIGRGDRARRAPATQ